MSPARHLTAAVALFAVLAAAPGYAADDILFKLPDQTLTLRGGIANAWIEANELVYDGNNLSGA